MNSSYNYNQVCRSVLKSVINSHCESENLHHSRDDQTFRLSILNVNLKLKDAKITLKTLIFTITITHQTSFFDVFID